LKQNPKVLFHVPVLKAHSHPGNIQEASELLDNMIGCGIVPDDSLYDTVINGLCKQSKFDTGMKFYNQIERKGIFPSITSYISLIRGLLQNCKKQEANELLNNIFVKKSGL
jgi:leucine-rich PPR motif-containing protein, mitochondrial